MFFVSFELLSKGDYVVGGDKHNSHGIAIKCPKESSLPNMPIDGPERRFMVILNDADACEPIAVMFGNLISSVRTGCVPGVAAR